MPNDTYELNTAEAFLFHNSRRMAELYPDPDLHEAKEKTFVIDLAHAVGQYLGELDIELATTWAAHFTVSLLDVKGGNYGPVQLSVPVRAPAVVMSSQTQATLPLSEPVKQAEPALAVDQELADVFVPGKAIKAFRDQHKWSQARMGKEVGLSATTICYMENDKRVGSRGDYLALRVVMKLPVEARA